MWPGTWGRTKARVGDSGRGQILQSLQNHGGKFEFKLKLAADQHRKTNNTLIIIIRIFYCWLYARCATEYFSPVSHLAPHPQPQTCKGDILRIVECWPTLLYTEHETYSRHNARPFGDVLMVPALTLHTVY